MTPACTAVVDWSSTDPADGKAMFRWLAGLTAWCPENARARIRSGNIPARMRVAGSVDLARASWLRQLPEELECTLLNLTGCINLARLPERLTCDELIVDRTNITQLPEKLIVRRRILARWCRRLRFIPPLKTLTLDLSGCTSLITLHAGLAVRELVLADCTRLRRLPADTLRETRRLDLSGCSALERFPDDGGPLQSVNVSGCAKLDSLPDGLRIRSWIDVAGSGLRSVPWSLRSTAIHWRGVPVSDRIAFGAPEDISIREILAETNLTMRRVLLERIGLARLVDLAGGEVVDRDQDPGGERRLLRFAFDGGENIVCVIVHCPSTGSRYVLRVPPTVQTCHEAVAWTAGFTRAESYQPLQET